MPSDDSQDAVSGSTILRVYNYEPGTKAIKQKKTLELPNDLDLAKATLGSMRSLLVQNKVFDSPDVTTPFCDKVGAEMDDSMIFSVYLDQLDDGSGKDDKKGGKKEKVETAQETTPDDPKKTKSKKGGPVNSGVKFLKIYYKKRKLKQNLDTPAKEFLKKQLDLKLQSAPELKDVRAELLSSAFNAEKWKASTIGKRSIAANLNERDWSIITRVNCLLSGYKLIFDIKPAEKDKDKVTKEAEIKPLGVERSPYNVFRLKERIFDDYEVAAPPNRGKPPNGVNGSNVPLKFSFRIPRFQVDDASYVNVSETKTKFASSLAKSSFSESSVEASAGGGFWGVSAAAKAGYKKEQKEKSLTANSTLEDNIHITYNFPRVTVFLDANSLELTPEVKDDIAKLKNFSSSPDDFRDKYGDIFSQRVKLGGKLTSTTHLKSTDVEKKHDRENALKISAAASFTGSYGSLSAEGSVSSGEKHKDEEHQQDFSNTLSWEATGGDTTLCNDPPNWCPTVGSFYNWRIVEHDAPTPLSKLISTFEGFEDFEDTLERAAGYEPLTTRKHVYIDVRLIETKTERPLIASNYSDDNSLKRAVDQIIATYPTESPSFGISTEDFRRQISIGGVKIDNHFNKSQNSKRDPSVWTLARWAKIGEDGKHHPYGVKSYLFNKSMNDNSKYLGVTGSISRSDASGYLYPTSESEKAWFTFQSPPGKAPKTGPIKTNDIVEIRVRDKGDSADLGALMRSTYTGGKDKVREGINNDIKKVPGFVPSEDSDNNTGNNSQSDGEVDERILQFRVEVVQTSSSQ